MKSLWTPYPHQFPKCFSQLKQRNGTILLELLCSVHDFGTFAAYMAGEAQDQDMVTCGYGGGKGGDGIGWHWKYVERWDTLPENEGFNMFFIYIYIIMFDPSEWQFTIKQCGFTMKKGGLKDWTRKYREIMGREWRYKMIWATRWSMGLSEHVG